MILIRIKVVHDTTRGMIDWIENYNFTWYKDVFINDFEWIKAIIYAYIRYFDNSHLNFHAMPSDKCRVRMQEELGDDYQEFCKYDRCK